MKAISFATLCFASMLSYSVSASYPFVLYSNSASNDKPEENTSPVKFADVLGKYKEFVGEKNTNVLVFVKEGLTSQDFAKYASQYPFLHEKIANGHSFTFSNVNGGFDLSNYESHIGAHQKYTLNDLADLEPVTESIIADLKSTNALFKVSIVNIGVGVSSEKLDSIVQKIESQSE